MRTRLRPRSVVGTAVAAAIAALAGALFAPYNGNVNPIHIGFETGAIVLIWVAIGAVILAMFVVGMLLVVAKQYKRCPSNRVLVIYGKVQKGRSATCVHGGGRFVWPIIQDYAYLSLEPIQIEIPLRGALSMENIRVNVPSVFTVGSNTGETDCTSVSARCP